ncbi:MAG: hypothetical protein KGN79_13465 [Acidobacteriota bacterium]|nr:hypothetical protein [Acidobacteriota bacterium]
MNFRRSIKPFAALALAAVLSLSGCKSNTPAAQDQTAQQPAAGQPAADGSSAPAPADGGYAPARSRSSSARTQQPPPPPPPPAAVDLPEGTPIRVRLDQDLGSKISQAGDSFSATVADDVMVNGEVIIPRGSRADGTVIDAKPLGKFKGGAALAIRLERVHTKYGSYPVATSTVAKAEKGKGKRSTGFIAGGAGLGALIGGLAGGGKGAAIGALAGGGAGTAGAAFTGNKQIFLPAESLLTFRLEHSVHIVESGAEGPAQ